jgi:hypothetical protein
MPSPLQLDANRRNAQYSTGPRTQPGKAASSRNATKHNLTGSTFAILPGEDIDAFEQLSRVYRDEWNPKTPHETFLVNSMVQARWRLDRIARMEAEAFDQLLNVPMADGKTDEGALVALYPLRGALLDKLHRYARDNDRAYHRAVRELKQYRKSQAEENKQQTSVKSAKRNEPNRVAADISEPVFHEPCPVVQRPAFAVASAQRASTAAAPASASFASATCSVVGAVSEP